jgi:hypothetical protein
MVRRNPVNPVLYLDIDNVLNDQAWILSHERDNMIRDLRTRYPGNARSHIRRIDIRGQYTSFIRDVVKVTSCDIVVCSNWRRFISLEELNTLFMEHGFQAIRCTDKSLSRVGAILADVALHKPNHWCVVDNDVSPFDVSGHGVFIEDGITPSIYCAICDVLKGVNLYTPGDGTSVPVREARMWWDFRESICRLASEHAGRVIPPKDVESYLRSVLGG